MRHPITGRRISLAKYRAEEIAFAKRIKEMQAEEKAKQTNLIGTRCECGAPYRADVGGYACAKLGTDSIV
jgi:hypothetical protein